MNKIYISGPMSGFPMKNKKMFDAAEKRVKRSYFLEVINPTSKPTEILDREVTEKEYLLYMKEDIFDILFDIWWLPYWIKRSLVKKGGVTFMVTLPKWKQSKGAKFEMNIAKFFKLRSWHLKKGDLKHYV